MKYFTLPPVLAATFAGATLVSLNDSSSILTILGPAHLPQTASGPLHPALASFSIETAFFVEYLGNSSGPNELSQNLLQGLKDRTGVPPEIRIGGITADSTYWNASQKTALINAIDSTGALQNTTLGPGFWDSVKLLPEDTKIIMTLDLEDMIYKGALEMAEAAWKGLGSGQATFEIGNEVDQYFIFSPQSYSQIWKTWSKNISNALDITKPDFQLAATAIDPLWPYNTTQAESQLDCVSALAAGANSEHTAKTCSEHTYQYSVCDPPRIAVATLPNLVNHTRLAQYLDLWQPRITSVRKTLGPDSFVIGEYNSVSCSGKDGVSNTFGQALWLLDTTLYAASLNVSRLYMHQGGPLALQSAVQLNHGGLSFYNMWYPVDNQNGATQVFPSYAAYLFVAEILGHSTAMRIANIYPGRIANGSTVTTAEGDTSAGQLVVYGLWDGEATEWPSKLALLNLQIYNETQAAAGVIRPITTFDFSAFVPKRETEVTARRMTAAGADVKRGNETTWAGQTFASGVGVGKLVEEKVKGSQVNVSASEAVLLFL